MKTLTAEKIQDYIKDNQQASVIDLIHHFSFSRQAIQRQLKKLVLKGVLKKIGKPPKVFYALKKATPLTEKLTESLLSNSWAAVIENRFLYITPGGEIKNGLVGFVVWCEKHNLPIEKTALEYINTLKKYDVFKVKDTGLINGFKKIQSSFKQVYLDQLFYLDFYSIERFGKTKLGQMLLYAKQTQNQGLIDKLIMSIYTQVHTLIIQQQIDAVGFIPPTIKREVQFMHILEKKLHLNQPVITLTKVANDVAIPQKSLTKLDDRIENARETIMVQDQRVFKNILLIDDAVGSGATLNETAKKIKDKGICSESIIGLALTGSYKGFDVISEV